MVGIGNK